MKKSVIIALALFGFCNSNAQITLLSSDMPDVGDVITRHIDTVPAFGPGNEGTGQTWDFSLAVIEDTAVTNVSAINFTPYASAFPSSSYAMHGTAASYLYFTETSQQLITDGAAGDLLGTGEMIEVPFSDPLILHEFPRDFGDTQDDTYAFQAEADGSSFGVYRIRLTHTGHVYDTTDGYGTLITPFGNYDALRVKTVDFTTDVIETKLTSFLPWTTFSTTMDTATTYGWHAKEEMLAIAEMNFDSIGNPRQFTFSTVPPVTTVSVGSSETDVFRVYPQPANEVLYFGDYHRFQGASMEVYSSDGRLIMSETLNRNYFSTSALTDGFYILRLTLQGTEVHTQRFMVKH